MVVTKDSQQALTRQETVDKAMKNHKEKVASAPQLSE